MHITWLIELYTSVKMDIKMLKWWVWCNDYMRCLSVCQSIWCLYSSSISCPNNIIMVLVFLVNVPVHWFPFSLVFCSLLTSLLRLLSSSVSNVGCSCVGLHMAGVLFMLALLLLSASCFSSWVRMLSNWSVLICLCSWSQRYCSAEISVGFMCCLFHVTSLPVFFMWMWYDLPWWFWLPFPSIMPWVHVCPSSHWTTTVDPMGIETYILGVPLPLSSLVCLFTITS